MAYSIGSSLFLDGACLMRFIGFYWVPLDGQNSISPPPKSRYQGESSKERLYSTGKSFLIVQINFIFYYLVTNLKQSDFLSHFSKIQLLNSTCDYRRSLCTMDIKVSVKSLLPKLPWTGFRWFDKAECNSEIATHSPVGYEQSSGPLTSGGLHTGQFARKNQLTLFAKP